MYWTSLSIESGDVLLKHHVTVYYVYDVFVLDLVCGHVTPLVVTKCDPHGQRMSS